MLCILLVGSFHVKDPPPRLLLAKMLTVKYIFPIYFSFVSSMS